MGAKDPGPVEADAGTQPRWFDDWSLTVSGNTQGQMRIELSLPHNEIPGYAIYGRADDPGFVQISNLLDKMLSELTGTKVKEVIREEK